MAADENAKPRPGHSLADHEYGLDFAHTHDGSADHDHDYFDDDGPIEENPLWIQDNVSLTSVGMDIGSSGTQVIFSRLKLRRLGEDLSSRYVVVSRETVFESDVALTPYQSEERIDDAALGAIIGDAYDKAGIRPEEIDTGAVILTGEALRRENAQAIAGILAEQGGEFVCAAAGHHMESMLAAYGSGAARVSHDEHKRILNIDIGGGTTKLGLVEEGRIVATAAVHVGGRLQVVDDDGRIVRLDPAGRFHARRSGFDWERGATASPAEMDKVAADMADALVAALTAGTLPHDVEHLYLTDPLPEHGPIDAVLFSGGVAEYIYGREDRDFGDMGRRLGLAIRARLDAGALPWPVLPAGECIRATALGASEYSVQLSGNTSYISSPGELLPRRNLQVLQPSFACEEEVDSARLAEAIRRHRASFDLQDGTEAEFALALRWQGLPSYRRLVAFARGIAEGLKDKIAAGRPIFIMLDGDVAQTLGAILRDELNVASELLVIDGVVLWDFDYIDLGRLRLPSRTVPVTIKSLVFSDDPRTRQFVHHHDHDHGHGLGGAGHHHHHDGHTHGHGHNHGHHHGNAHGHIHENR